MTRSELVERLVAQNPRRTTKDFDRIVKLIFQTVSEHLAKGGSVELRGFGSFSTRAREGRIGRNPRTGEAVEVLPRRAVYFRPGKEMRALVRDSNVRN